MMEEYYKLTDYDNYGTLIKTYLNDENLPRAMKYNKETKEWKPVVGFFSDYMLPEEDNKYDMYDEISESEAEKYMTDSFVETAHEIARQAHKGQKDKAGVDYIKHPEFVASQVRTNDDKATAYLHDVLEDTSVTSEELLQAGIPEAVVKAVKILTKEKGEDYFTYLEKVRDNEIARKVKLADLRHNSDLSRLENVEEKDRERLAKYRKAQKFLEDF
jgi:(p)ppGpp synthase/HD superfamily hydrolase